MLADAKTKIPLTSHNVEHVRADLRLRVREPVESIVDLQVLGANNESDAGGEEVSHILVLY